jgi:phospho-N-acetylmuramoyl-pentapeptide-transferase
MNFTLHTAVYAILIAFTFNIVLAPIIIPYLIRLKFGQNVRDDGPQTHLKKSGTPSMGGVIILLSFLITSLFFIKNNYTALMLLFVTMFYGIIGFVDDYIKVVKKRSLGLRPLQKIIAQLVVSSIFIYFLLIHTDTKYMFSANNISPTAILIPFTDGKILELGKLYIPFAFIVLIATVNSVNLTDGLDGLASGVTVLVSTFFLFISWAANSGSLPIAGAAVGSLLGFLLFNSHPAAVFMGDTGSLALGGFIAATSLILKTPAFIVIVGIVYVIESVSVIIQVVYFKFTKKRFFKMAPIHHSFELSGWAETKVVALFYIVTAIACLIGFLGAKYIF